PAARSVSAQWDRAGRVAGRAVRHRRARRGGGAQLDRAGAPRLTHHADASAPRGLEAVLNMKGFRLTLMVISRAVAISLPAYAADTRVMLKVQSKSWIRDSAFDVEDFDRLCSKAGIELASPASTQPVVATAVVVYSEAKGPGFSRFGVGAPVGYGTNIDYKL